MTKLFRSTTSKLLTLLFVGLSVSFAAYAALPRPKSTQQDLSEFIITHPQVTADTTTTEFKTGPARFRITGVSYVNATGLAGNASNFYNIVVQHGSATAAFNWSTSTAQQGTIAADTFVELVPNAGVLVPANTRIQLLLDLTGTATLPAGKLVVRGWYL